MSAILKFDFKKKKKSHFSEENYLNYAKKVKILHVTITFSLEERETGTGSGPIFDPLR